MISFQPWKAAKVESGECTCTIRQVRKRPIAVGDVLYLWESQRSPRRRKLGKAVCTKVTPIAISSTSEDFSVKLAGDRLSVAEVDELAQTDGFAGSLQFHEFFVKHYGDRSFEGVLIEWAEFQPEAAA